MDAEAKSLRYVVIGANHRSCAATTRDRLFVEEERIPAMLDRLRDNGLRQALLLSTCARIEVQATHTDLDEATKSVTRVLSQQSGFAVSELMPQVYTKADQDAIRHVFSVVASLDSPVIGEPQVTGQVKDSHRISAAAGMVGPELESLLQAAYGVAKRVRNETAIGERPVSIAAAALQLAREVHGELGARSGLLLLGGDMGELIAEYLLSGGLGRLTVASRVAARGETAAGRLGCHHAPIELLPELLSGADIVIASLGTGRHALQVADVRAALSARRLRPMFFIDAAVPGDVDPEVNRLDGAFVYDLGDLERVVARGRAGRDAAAAEARQIIDQEVDTYARKAAARDAVPALTDLRDHFESTRRAVLKENAGRDTDDVSRRLVARLLHAPFHALNELAGSGDVAEAERVLRRLFGLLPSPGTSSENDRDN